jgi:hypothetical protein
MKTAAAILAALIAFTLGLLSCTPPANSAESTPGVTYAAHVQRIGWQAPVDDGATAGTTGRALRVEALRLSPSGGATLAWRGHVQKQGWQSWRDTPAMIGTTGKGLRLEAFQITVKDSGQLYGDVSVEYRAHVQGIGWQPWVKDGATAGTVGSGLRVEAVEIRIVPATEPTPTVTPTPSPTPTPTAAPVTRLAFTADTGMDENGKAVLDKIGAGNYDVTSIIGDFAYVPNREQQFCDQVNSRVPGKVAIVAGNHEEIPNPDGTMEKYEACLPNEVNAVPYTTSRYGRDYYFDTGNVRVILISPDIPLTTGTKTYVYGTQEREWLKKVAIDGRAAGKWVVLGYHHPCFSIGLHACKDTKPSLSELAIGLGADVVVTGHDHNYQRTHQIRGSKAAPVVIDKDNAYKRQTTTSKGTTFVVVGNGGWNPRTITQTLPAWMKVVNGTNSPGGMAFGYGELIATNTVLTWNHVSASGATLADSFTVTR